MAQFFEYHQSTNKNSLPSGHPVCMAVTFNAAGEMRPDAFGVEINSLRYRYRIESYQLVGEIYGYAEYLCNYTDLGLAKTVTLVYRIRDHRWTVK